MSDLPTPMSPVHRRLHPSTLIFSLGGIVRNSILPAILALLSGGASFWIALLLVTFVTSTVVAVTRYITLTWRLEATELVVREGLFFKSERHVPYTRIQNVDLVQSVFHRPFRVAEVRLETAGGEEPEAVLSVLRLDDIATLRTRLRQERAGESGTAASGTSGAHEDAVPEDEGVLLRVPPRHLVFLGFVVHRGLALVGAGILFLVQVDELQMLLLRLGLAQWIQSLIDTGEITTYVALAAAGLLILVGLSIAWSLIRFWGFTLQTADNDLRLSCGWLTRITASIPSPRIQSLTISASWLHRRFGLASIGANTAGGVSEGSVSLVRSRFVPVLPALDTPRIVGAAMPDVPTGTLAWQTISRRAVGRLRRRGLLLVGMAALPLALLVSPWTLLGTALLLTLVWYWADAAVARARFARTAWGLVWERGVFTRRTTFLPGDKIQTVRLATSPFDRRHDHATLLVDAAGGGRASTDIRIRYLDQAVADALNRDLGFSTARTEYQVRERPSRSPPQPPIATPPRPDIA